MSGQFLKDKAREISYALIKVAWYVKRSDLRLRLEVMALELLENASRVSVDNSLENMNKALATISVLDSVVRLAHSIYEVEPVNATILVRELDGLNVVIRQSGNLPPGEEELPDLETIFKVKPISSELDLKSESGSSGNSSSASGLNAAIRQAAIVNRIKSGNPLMDSGQMGCRLKDLINDFSDVSERTLRYDLQRLCEQGAIERVGSGGPASYYTVKEESGVIN